MAAGSEERVRAAERACRRLRRAILVAVSGWLGVFGIANVIPSEPFRMCFDPTVDASAERVARYLAAPETMPFFPAACIFQIRTSATVASKAAAGEPPKTAGVAVPSTPSVAAEGTTTRIRYKRQPPGPWQQFGNLLIAILVFPPTSIAVLGVLAGAAGGGASRLLVAKARLDEHYDDKDDDDDANDGADAAPVLDVSSPYLSESVFVAAARGFAVTLAYLAGLAATVGLVPEAKVDPTAASYATRASIASLLAFLAAYDLGMFLQFMPGGAVLKAGLKDSAKP